MHKLYFIVILYFCLNNLCFANNYSNYNNPDNSILKSLNQSEWIILGRNNPSMNPIARLTILEQHIFGSAQIGSFNDRVNFVNQVARNYNRNTIRVNNPLKKFNKIKNVFNNIYEGNVTGFTPQIYDTPNAEYYSNARIPQSINNCGNRNFISKTSIIIDNDN